MTEPGASNQKGWGPRLSIVTPVLNQRSYLVANLRATATLETPVEHVVVDGGSEDGSAEVAARAARACRPDVVFVPGPDRGLYNGLNKGFRAAGGEVLGYVNCDDALMPWTPALVTQVFADHPEVDLVVGDCLELTGDRAAFVVQPPAKALDRFFRGGGFLPQPAVFFRRTLFGRLGGFDPSFRLLGDQDFFVRALRSGAKAARLWEVVAVQRQMPGRLMERWAEEAMAEKRRLITRESWGDVSPGVHLTSRAYRAFLHRAAVACVASGGLPGLDRWRRAARSGYFRVSSRRALARVFVTSSRQQRFLELTSKGRTCLGLVDKAVYKARQERPEDDA